MICDADVTTIPFGDTSPALTWTVNKSLVGVDTVSILAVLENTLNPVIVLAATITNAAAGEVTHVPTGTLPEGTYDLKLKMSDGSSAPTMGFAKLVVTRNLTAP